MPSISFNSREPISRNCSAVANKRTYSSSSSCSVASESYCVSLEINRKKSFDSSSSSDYSNHDDQLSIIQEGCVSNDVDNDDQISFNLESGANENQELIRKIKNQTVPTRITLKLHITENSCSIWETVLYNSNKILYVALPSKINHEASKHSFISLLEFAEEKLNASAVVLCMRKDRSDRQSLVRTFLFLGFQPLDPRSVLAPPQNSLAKETKSDFGAVLHDYLYLICNFDE
uniref:Ornithine decarboxylase antizyme n=1 Tax=Culicoides sonorensis TaxID=179676 RepID=A0A336M348_CULSO